jgi:hypothetical protein
MKIPVVENIHSKILEAVTAEGNSINMSSWHSCDTTHCRAGWAVHIAGKEGYELESQTSTQFAAMQIFKASSDVKVSPVRFFESDKEAMADIVRCAELEKSHPLKGKG